MTFTRPGLFLLTARRYFPLHIFVKNLKAVVCRAFRQSETAINLPCPKAHLSLIRYAFLKQNSKATNEISTKVVDLGNDILETKFKSKQSIWTIKRVWQDTHWYVTYREISGVKKALFYKVCPSSPDIKQCIFDLKNAIQSAQKLCDTIGYHGFEEDFQEAHRLLNDTDRLDNVLNGALSACVFAGMGSWNDEVAAICEDKNIPQHQYTEVTNALFSAILNVVCGICSY